MNEVVLFDYPRSSAAYRVRIALNLLGVDYQRVLVDLTAGEQRGVEHLARNPMGLVPVLDIDGRRLTQSLAIIEYLDETRSAGFLPIDPQARVRLRALAMTIAIDIHPVCNLSVATRASALSEDPEQAKADWMRHFIRRGLAAFEQLLSDLGAGPFCHGERPGLADIVLVPQLYNAQRWSVDVSDLERIGAVAAACQALPAFRAAAPEAV